MSPKDKIQVVKEAIILTMLLRTANTKLLLPLVNKVKLIIPGASIESIWNVGLIESTLDNILRLLLGDLMETVNAVLESKFGTNKPITGHGPEIEAISAICGATRNAFAHDPIEPKWNITNTQSPYNNVWTVFFGKVNVTVDLRNKHGQVLQPTDFGTPENLILLADYIQSII